MKIILLSIATLSLIALGACGGEPTPQPSASKGAAVAQQKPLPRACLLITEQDAAAVLDQPVGLMSDEEENCIWTSAGNPGQIAMLLVQISREDSVEEADTIFGAMTNMPGDLNALINGQMEERTQKSGQEIDDLGDAAWRSASNADLIGTEQLVVRSGTVVFQLNITGMTKTGKLNGLSQRLEVAARRAMERI